MPKHQAYGTTSRRHILELLVVLTAIAAYNRAVPLVNEKAYEEFLYKAMRGEIIIRGAVGITRVQGNVRGTATSGTTISVTWPSAPTNGNTLIAVIGTSASNNLLTVSSISQTGATWVKDKGQTLGVNDDCEIWHANNVQSAGTSVTVNLTGSGTLAAGIADLFEYSGLDSSSPLDKTASNSSSSSSTGNTGTTATTTINDELWMGGILAGSGSPGTGQSTPTNGFTLYDGAIVNANASVAALEKIVTTTGTANSGTTFSKSGSSYAGCIVTYKIAATLVNVSDSGAGTDTPSLTATFTVSQSGAGADTPSMTANLAISSSGVGTDILLSLTATLIINDSGLGTEPPATIGLSISDLIVGVDIAWRVQGEISVDGVTLPHVLSITITEPVNLDTRPVNTGLPIRQYLGKKGRTVQIPGWTDSLATLNQISGYADGAKHAVILPSGEGVLGYISPVQTPHDIETPAPGLYSYQVEVQEAID